MLVSNITTWVSTTLTRSLNNIKQQSVFFYPLTWWRAELNPQVNVYIQRISLQMFCPLCSISCRPSFLPDVFSHLLLISCPNWPSINIFSLRQGRPLSRRASTNLAATWWGLGPIAVSGLICTTWVWPMASCECRRMADTTCTRRWALCLLTLLSCEVAKEDLKKNLLLNVPLVMSQRASKSHWSRSKVLGPGLCSSPICIVAKHVKGPTKQLFQPEAKTSFTTGCKHMAKDQTQIIVETCAAFINSLNYFSLIPKQFIDKHLLNERSEKKNN